MSRLIDILPKKFMPLNTAEEKLLKAVEDNDGGEIKVDYRSGDEETDKTENADKWGEERTIRGEFLVWILTDKIASKKINAKGVFIVGTKVNGTVDLSYESLPFPFTLFQSSCGLINLSYAKVAMINFNKSHFAGIDAKLIKVKGHVSLRKTKVHGEVSLSGATIDGQMDCENAELINENGVAFDADWINVKGGISFRETKAQGEVRMLGADIGVQMDCENAEFRNKNGRKIALGADGMKVHGSLFLKSAFKAEGDLLINGYFKSYGQVRLPGVEIDGQIDCTNAIFNGDLILQTAKIEGPFFVLCLSITGTLDLTHAKAGQLIDNDKRWPSKKKLDLIGFEYDSIAGDSSPMKAEDRLERIALQDEEKRFSPQPYEQLAKVYKKMGHESDARAVQFAKHEAIRKFGQLNEIDKAKSYLLGMTIGHGYNLLRVIPFIAFFVIFGTILFSMANYNGVMVSSKGRISEKGNSMYSVKPYEDYVTFNAFIYSVDTFLPLVNFHQEDYWLPNANDHFGELVRIYLWLHIALGWVFSSLLVAVLTGLIKKE